MTDLAFPVSAYVTKPRNLVERDAPGGPCAFPVRYGVFVHPTQGPVLFDTGYTDRLWTAGGFQLALYRTLLGPKLVADGQPEAVLASMGFEPGDVRHVVVTHLHADHVCGLDLFPEAKLHMSGASLWWWECRPSLADATHGFMRRLMPPLDVHRVRTFDVLEPVDLPWGGTGRDILGDGTMVAVQLPGHMRGHWGVFLPLRNEPVLFAVDATWSAAAYREDRSPGIGARRIVDDIEAMRTTARMLAAIERKGVRVVLSHDPEEVAPFK